jgi:hypothetical protein
VGDVGGQNRRMSLLIVATVKELEQILPALLLK